MIDKNDAIDHDVMIGVILHISQPKHLKNVYLYIENSINQVRKLTEKEVISLVYSTQNDTKIAESYKAF